ncbi:MAG: flippase [Desulfuromonadales bacterium]|nr:flippase [Desulfuromonadales bacterium]
MNRHWVSYLPFILRSRLEGRLVFQQMIANTSWLLLDRALRLCVGLFIGVWVARYLGPEQFGTLNYVTALVSMFGAFASLGLEGIVVREIVRTPALTTVILSSAFALRLSASILSIFLLMLSIVLMRPADYQSAWLVGIIGAGLLFQSFDVIDLWFRSQVQSKYSVFAKNAAFIISAALKVVLVLSKAPLAAFACVALTETVLGAAGLIFFYVRIGSLRDLWHPVITTTRWLLKAGWPLLLTSLTAMVYMRIDQIMIGQMLGDKEVGIFSAAVRISEVWYFIPTAIVGSAFPAIMTLKMNDEVLYSIRLQMMYTVLTMLGLCAAIIVTFFSHDLIQLLYGAKFTPAADILSLHIWSGIFVFQIIASGSWLMAENLQLYSLYRAAIGCVVNVILNIFMIPQFGILGAAYSTLISYASVVVSLLFFARTRQCALMIIRSFWPFSGFRQNHYTAS